MKVLIIGEKSYYTDSLIYSFKKLNYNVCVYFVSSFVDNISWMQRKQYFWGLDDGLLDRFIDKESNDIKHKYDQCQPDIVLVFGTYSIAGNIVNCMKKDSKVIMWLIDSLKEKNFYYKIYHKLKYFDFICTYEKDDVEFLRNNVKSKVLFCPVGTDERFYKKTNIQPQNIDITFVGVRSEYRLAVLEKIAQYAYANKLKMVVYGISFEHNARHFWKKIREKQKFAANYPSLSRYIVNVVNIPPAEVAELYKKSKIVLNINRTNSVALNPRTFEIIAVGAFEIMDKRADYSGLIHPGEDLVVYDNENDLMDKIAYYLYHDEERENIAEQGYNRLNGKFTMTNIVRNLMNNL